MKTVTIIIYDAEKGEHLTYVENQGKFFKFYFDGFEGTSHKDVSDFLKFMGLEVFEVYRDITPPNSLIVNQII